MISKKEESELVGLYTEMEQVGRFSIITHDITLGIKCSIDSMGLIDLYIDSIGSNGKMNDDLKNMISIFITTGEYIPTENIRNAIVLSKEYKIFEKKKQEVANVILLLKSKYGSKFNYKEYV